MGGEMKVHTSSGLFWYWVVQLQTLALNCLDSVTGTKTL